MALISAVRIVAVISVTVAVAMAGIFTARIAAIISMAVCMVLAMAGIRAFRITAITSMAVAATVFLR